MSTRRARIKAVAALPQRRKNADNAVNKAKELSKELIENVLKSPKDGRKPVEKNSTCSPVRITPSPRKPSPRKSPRTPLTPDPEKVPTDWKVPTPTVLQEKRSGTPVRDKSETRIIGHSFGPQDVFVSPPAKTSPFTRCSPVVKKLVSETDIDVEKHTPHKRLLELQGSQKQSVSDNGDNIILSPKPTNDAINPTKSTSSKNNIDSYTNPITPENDVMDGIVPLKQINSAPKPIDVLKNEIISENAEVLFDPIVPLPSPTKVRQKLRPVPRLGPMRRNSIPGSASESEDESRRVYHGGSSTPVPSRQRHDSHTSHSNMSHPNRDINRVRNDSMCSSQMAPQTPAPGSPMKDKTVIKINRRVDVSRRMAAMRRRKESIQRDKLTMFDLIFYNPLTNPIIPDQDELKAKEATMKEEEQRKLENSKKEEADDEADSSEESAAPVPQIKLGPNGEIILDEQSLVIKQSEQRKLSESVVHEGAWMSSSGRVYRRTPRTADWCSAETVRFYRALAALGTDFSLMATLFPGRSRRDLKLKFKKEERANLAQIDKALRSNLEWNPDRLESEFADERRRAEENAREAKERLQETKKALKEQAQISKERRAKHSRGAKVLGMSAVRAEEGTANQLIEEAIKARKNRRQRTASARHSHSALPPQLKPNPPNPDFATLTPTANKTKGMKVGIPRNPNMATIQKTTPPHKSPLVLNALPAVPSDITPGSLVVLTVDDPKAPSQKAIHTFVKQADGSITSIILDPSVMSSLVSFVRKDTPKAASASMSPSSVVSDRTNTPPISASPNKRKRLPSYTITNL